MSSRHRCVFFKTNAFGNQQFFSMVPELFAAENNEKIQRENPSNGFDLNYLCGQFVGKMLVLDVKCGCANFAGTKKRLTIHAE